MRYVLLALVCVVWNTYCNSSSESPTYIDNGVIRVGIDPKYGGSISYLAYSKTPETNLINRHDLGREIQLSFYAGPPNFCPPAPSWPNWSWNPISAGDAYGNPSRIVEIKKESGSILYVKSVPYMWACNHVECECEFIWRISILGTYVKVEATLNNHRADHADYGKRDQELPAFYTIGKLWQMWTYTGGKPWTYDTPSMHTNHGPPWEKFAPTEGWAAFTMDQTTDHFGLGLVSPGKTQLLSGFAGSDRKGGEYDSSTGYLAFVDQVDLVWDLNYSFTFYLVLGNLDTIRGTAYHLQGH